MRQRIIGVVVAATVALAATAAEAATAQATTAMHKWKTMDTCEHQAHVAFPDYSAESNAKRDAALQNCLNANRLPPRAPGSQTGQ
jgi:hypothetical protein